MIYVDLKGRLGNQLFEYAFARKMQLLSGEKIIFNTRGIQEDNSDAYHIEEQLHYFKLNDNCEFSNNKLPWYTNEKNFISKISRKINARLYKSILANFNAYVWYNPTYVEISEPDFNKDIYISGYWQCPQYFDDIRDLLLEEFTPKQPLRPENKELFDIICNTESVCVTIRRGDYLSVEKFRKYYYLCDEDYFNKGVEIIKKKIPNCNLIIFSDDIEWCKENLDFECECYYESGNDPIWEKVRLMSACKHFIISNSSFSWWAQYLSRNNNKIVIAPSRWYADGTKADIFENSWTLIDI